MEIKVLTDLLEANDTIAQENHRLLADCGVKAINLMSSPGAGKTALLEKTLSVLKDEIAMGVILGDVSTSRDAERLAGYGITLLQINTRHFGGTCHLDANMIKSALSHFDLNKLDILFIENVGNLVCPAAINLGEDYKVVILSVTEGDDKPAKYPAMFEKADLLIINKIDLLPHTDCNLEIIKKDARLLNSRLKIQELSARTGEGLPQWWEWLRSLCN